MNSRTVLVFMAGVLATLAVLFCLCLALVLILPGRTITPAVWEPTTTDTEAPDLALNRGLTSTPVPSRASAATTITKGEIVIKDEKFIQHGQGLYWIWTLYNPGPQTIGSVYIYVDAFDSTDTVFDSNYEAAPCVYPGEIRKVVGYAKLPDKVKFGRYTTRAVSQSSGCAGMQFEQNPLSVVSMEIQASGRVVAVIGNSSDKNLRQVGVDALAYDSAGEYIGSTHPFLELVPAHGKARIELGFFEPWGRISKVEIYPAFTSITRIE